MRLVGHRNRILGASVAIGLAIACKPGGGPAPATTTIPSAPVTTSSVPPLSSSPSVAVNASGGANTNAVAATPAANATGAPPALKPIAKGPFPDGATEEQVCEAILDGQQTDLWVRFGHLIPAYRLGVVFVLEAGTERVSQVYDYVMSKYNGGGAWGPAIKACGRLGMTMLYIKSFGPDGVLDDGRTTGPKHLAGELLQATGIRTKEWYQFLDPGKESHQSGDDRLSDYCRSDAYICEGLIRLQSGADADGLCPWALSRVSVDERSPNYATLYARCRNRKGPPFACAMYRKTPAEEDECRSYIRKELRIP